MDADPVVIRQASLPRQVADFIRQAINRGEYEPGAILPPERLLTGKYQVSMTVVRQALLMLVAEGAVIKINGKGTVVRGRPGPPKPLPRTAADPWAELTPTGQPEHMRGTAKPRMAELLGIPEGSSLFIVHQAATHTSGRPVLTCRTLPTLALSGIDEPPDPFGYRDQIMTALDKRHGPLIVTEHVRPLMPDGDERDALRLGPGELLMEVIRVTRDQNDTGLMAESERYGEGVELRYTLT